SAGDGERVRARPGAGRVRAGTPGRGAGRAGARAAGPPARWGRGVRAREPSPARRGDGARPTLWGGRAGRASLRHAAASQAGGARVGARVVPLLLAARGRGRPDRWTARGAAGFRSVTWDELYHEEILDHYKHPRHRGTLEHPDISYADANPLCGDEIRIDLRVKDGVIEDVAFSGHGCSISQASASMLCERIAGRPLDEVKQLTREDVLEMLGIEL